MKKTVAVALSGGVDSTVAAALLKKANCCVIGLFFQTGHEGPPGLASASKPGDRPEMWAQKAADQVGIPLEVIDCSQLFQKEVVGYFIDAYRSGQTPNPCIICNQRIKFGFILERAMALGASILATGHYVRTGQGTNGQPCLLKGVDQAKEQSYFLAFLTQKQLGQAAFPLGNYTKTQVREIAKACGLVNVRRRESQELCFIKGPSYTHFLFNLEGFSSKRGAIVDTKGDVLGHHQGLHAYTIGQRRGIGISGPEPYYVLRLDRKENRLLIGTKSELAASECTVTHIHWIDVQFPQKAIPVKTRIRYRHREAASILTPIGDNKAIVRFFQPQYAITPGQAAVFYQGDRVLGGGWLA